MKKKQQSRSTASSLKNLWDHKEIPKAATATGIRIVPASAYNLRDDHFFQIQLIVAGNALLYSPLRMNSCVALTTLLTAINRP